MERDEELRRDAMDSQIEEPTDSRAGDGEQHATTGGAAAAGAVTGGVVGMMAGPAGAAVGAIGGAIIGAISERVMHSDDDHEGEAMGLPNDGDSNVFVEDRAKEHGVGTSRFAADRPYQAETIDRDADTGDSLQLKEEELVAQKREVETGRVGIEKDVVTEHRTLDVPVTREEVYVERRPVDRRPSDRPISEGDGNLDVTVHEEEVTVEKQPVVYEEVAVGKRTVQDTEHVSDEVRREVADIRRDGDVDVKGAQPRSTDRTF